MFNFSSEKVIFTLPKALVQLFVHILTIKKRSGYYGNLGSLKAGTRHHGDYSVMGTPSLQPFLKTYWLTPVNDWPIVAKHANMTSSRGSINAAPATIRQNLN